MLLFYPGDWSAQSEAFLSSFSSVTGGLGGGDCLVYGVSSDPVSSHQDWLSSTNTNPPFPLISDTAGLLATRCGLYEPPEEGEHQVEAERPPCRSVVITDNQAVMLELVNTSLEEEELLAYTQDRLDMLLQKRLMAVERARNRVRARVNVRVSVRVEGQGEGECQGEGEGQGKGQGHAHAQGEGKGKRHGQCQGRGSG